MAVTSQIIMKPSKDGRYIIGQSIVGVVKYSVTKPTQYKNITLSLICRGRCQWTKQKKHKGPGPATNSGKYIGNEKMVVEKMTINDNRQNLTVGAGTYEHLFEIRLPLNIPPSVNTEACQIKYYIVMEFEKPSLLKTPKKFSTKDITIYPNIPISIPDQPISFGLDKTLIILFNKKKQHAIRLKGKLDSGYLSPGRESTIYFVVSNDSDVNVSVRTELISKVVYTDDTGNDRREEAVIKELNSPVIPENSTANLFNTIPVWTDLYTVRCSKIMSREYKLKVIAKLPMPHTNASVEVPIVIGERRNEEVDEEFPVEEPPWCWETMSKDHSKD